MSFFKKWIFVDGDRLKVLRKILGGGIQTPIEGESYQKGP